MDDLAKEWDVLRENLPDDHAEAAEILFDRCDLMADRIEALEADVATALEAMRKVEDAMTAWNERQDKSSFGALGEALDQMNMARAHLTGIPR